MTTHLIISDVQVRPGRDYRFLEAIGNYIIETRPDVVVNIGDFADMESLCTYDKGTKSLRQIWVLEDIENGFAVPRAIPLNYLIGNYL